MKKAPMTEMSRGFWRFCVPEIAACPIDHNGPQHLSRPAARLLITKLLVRQRSLRSNTWRGWGGWRWGCGGTSGEINDPIGRRGYRVLATGTSRGRGIPDGQGPHRLRGRPAIGRERGHQRP